MTDDVLRADKATQDHWIFQHAAIWPDIARGLQGDAEKMYNRPTWHYVTNPLFLDDSDRIALTPKLRINGSDDYPTDTSKDEYNLLQAFKHCQAVLRSQAGADTKAVAYCWLFHLVGDIHQPLHSTSLYSINQLPEGDRGGNSIPLGRGRNLHSLWDGLLGSRDRMRDVDKQVAEVTDRQLYGSEWDTAVNDLSPRTWANESHELCESIVYSDQILDAVRATPPDVQMAPIEVPTAYMQEAGNVARRRIVTAGVRLARLLQDTIE